MDSLTNHFLIAMPALADPNFEKTVTLVCQHDDEGALGVVVNRPTDMKVGDVLGQLDLDTDPGAAMCSIDPVFSGGPVQTELGMILHDLGTTHEATINVSDDIGLTMSLDMLEAMARNEGPNQAMLMLGYAGWGAGQLESEISQNAWLSVPADIGLIFDTAVDQRWHAAASRLGVDLSLLSGQAGRA